MLLLEKLLEGLNIEVRPFAICRIGRGATMSVPAFDEALVHYTLVGQGVLTPKGGTPLELSPGTMVILPKRNAHEVAAVGAGASMPGNLRRCGLRDQGIEVLESGWEGSGVVLTCGLVNATYQDARGLFDYLPAPIVERAKRGDAIHNAFSTLVRELADPQPGTAAMTAALIRQSLLVILRKHSERGVCNVPWLSALEHPQISKAIRQVLLEPGQRYTLELLAERAGMSRSAFSEHFAKTFGRTAMDFVKQVRMRHAARLLSSTTRPVKAIAAEVGYHSRSHFTQAFKDSYGVHPAAFRQRASSEHSRGADLR